MSKSCWWLCALTWGAICGFLVAALNGTWWQLPYFGFAALAFGLAATVALFWEDFR